METNDFNFEQRKFHKKDNRRNQSGRKNAPDVNAEYSFSDFLSDVGNKGITQLFEGMIQAKLNVSQPGDKSEKEADKIADAIVSNKADTIPEIHEVQPDRSKENDPGFTIPPITAERIKGIEGRGEPLDKALKSYFEPRFGVDLDKVRIHKDAIANRLSQSIHARAFASGNDIAFGKGEYQPETTEGKKLIAHELAHTIQQGKKQNHIQRYSMGLTEGTKLGEKLETEYEATIKNDPALWPERFLQAIRDKVGWPYMYAGGTGTPWEDPVTKIKYSNKDEFGNWLGYDCSGGINASLHEATGIVFRQRSAAGLSEAPFVHAISVADLQPGDLIFVNNPTGKDKNKNYIYDGIGHVLTYIGNNQVVTTDGAENIPEGQAEHYRFCDVRVNPASQVETKIENLNDFREKNLEKYPGAKWTYGRVDWKQLAK